MLFRSYIHYAAERGVPTMLMLVWLLAQSLVDFARALRQAARENQWVLQGAIAAIIAVSLSGFYELNLGDSEVLGLFLAVIACGYAAANSHLSPADR